MTHLPQTPLRWHFRCRRCNRGMGCSAMLVVYAALAVFMASVTAIFPNTGKLQMCDKPLRYQLQGDSVRTEDLHSLLAALPEYVRLVSLSIEGVSCKEQQCCTKAVFARPRTTDALVINMIHNEFDWLAKLDWHPRTILDAGGNGGFTALLFSHIFPEATIVVLEPEAENFAVLLRNTADNPNVHALKAALWKSDASLIMEHGVDDNAWGWSVKEVPPHTPSAIQGLSGGTLLKHFGLHGFDYAKIDIESAEYVVFHEAVQEEQWFRTVSLFSLEIHTSGPFYPGDDHALRHVFPDSTFAHWTSGELDVYMRHDHNQSTGTFSQAMP